MDNEKNNGDRQQQSQNAEKKVNRIRLCLIIFCAIVLVLYAISGLLVAISKPPLREVYQITKPNIPIPGKVSSF